VIAEFVVNNKIYSATKLFPFRVNYGRELRIETVVRELVLLEKL